MIKDKLPALYMITDRKSLTGQDIWELFSAIAQSGIKMVQIREKDMMPAELYDFSLRAINILRPAGVKVIINDRADVAMAVGADGVHLTSTGMPVNIVKKIMPANSLVGVSTHSVDGVLTAEKNGADFVTFGPVFYTLSKAKMGNPVGTDLLREASSVSNIPIYALGGINLLNAESCVLSGAYGLAGIGIFQNSSNLQVTVNNFSQICEKNA
jgi:thiamine-phosphate pyrophosphorylase